MSLVPPTSTFTACSLGSQTSPAMLHALQNGETKQHGPETKDSSIQTLEKAREFEYFKIRVFLRSKECGRHMENPELIWHAQNTKSLAQESCTLLLDYCFNGLTQTCISIFVSFTFILILDGNIIRAAQLPPEHPLHHKYQFIICYSFIVYWNTPNIVTQLGL
jgi:hypothetical protein